MSYLKRLRYRDLPKQREREKLEEPILPEEILEDIRSLKVDKSQVLDVLTGEFYKKFQEQIAPVLQIIFAECLAKNRIPTTWLEARIVVIPKEGKELTIPQNYRPISLLNSDYKILMTVMATRLNQVIGFYVQRHQAEFIKC